jgi:hypothetical protein
MPTSRRIFAETPYLLPSTDRCVAPMDPAEQVCDLPHKRPVPYGAPTAQRRLCSDARSSFNCHLDIGENHYGHVSPEEPRLGPDGAVHVRTLGCGIERISNIDEDEPSAKLVYTFPGSFCGVPTIVGHYFIQSVPLVHGVIALDTNSERSCGLSGIWMVARYQAKPSRCGKPCVYHD